MGRLRHHSGMSTPHGGGPPRDDDLSEEATLAHNLAALHRRREEARRWQSREGRSGTRLALYTGVGAGTAYATVLLLSGGDAAPWAAVFAAILGFFVWLVDMGETGRRADAARRACEEADEWFAADHRRVLRCARAVADADDLDPGLRAEASGLLTSAWDVQRDFHGGGELPEWAAATCTRACDSVEAALADRPPADPGSGPSTQLETEARLTGMRTRVDYLRDDVDGFTARHRPPAPGA